MKPTRNLVLLVATIAGLLSAPLATAQPYDSWTEWFDATGGSGSPPSFPGGPGGTPGPFPPVVFTDAPTFDAAFPGLPIEDFEESPTPPFSINGCEEPIDEFSSDSCFSPGDILSGLAVRTFEGIRAGCPADCPMVVLGSGLIGNADSIVGPNFFADTLLLEVPANVCALGMFVHTPLPDNLDVTVTTVSGTFMTTTPSSGAGNFFGLDTSTDPILSIRLASAAGNGELIDNVRVGYDTCAPVTAPTMNAYGLAALALVLALAGLVAVRRSMSVPG